MYDNTSRVIEVDINEILPNRFQPRIQFDEEEILELSDSIKEHGVIQPLVVRTIGDKYEIIAGERRYKASVLAGKETVPVIVKNLNDKDSAEIALIENIQRKNLTPIEEALSYKKILDMGYITQDNLASKLGKSQPAVANKIRLLNLSDEVQEALLENKISERHARSLLKLSTSKQQNQMLDRIINERLTVRKTDEEIEKLKNSSSDESNDDSQKIIEKGEIDMNNNMFGIPNVPQNQQSTTPNFDIFGTSNQQPVNNLVPDTSFEIPSTPSVPSFDIFGSTPVAPEIPSVPTFESVNSVPEVQPVSEMPSVSLETPEVPVIEQQPQAMPEMPTMGGFDFAPNFNTVDVPSENPMMDVPSMSAFEPVNSVPEVQPVFEIPNVAPVTPEVSVIEQQPQAVPEMPTMGGFDFAPNFNTVDVPSENPTMNIPNMSTILAEEPTVPVTSPIMESSVINDVPQMTQQSENLFSFGDNNVNSVEEQQPIFASMPEFKIPEPIIITDYSKQYDPVMPQVDPMAPTVDFKEVISAIRECSKKIEQYGFKIDVEEYDLNNLYQVMFKIEK